MATTFTFPTPVADPTAFATKLPLPVADPTAVGYNIRLPTPVFGATNDKFFVPTPQAGVILFELTPTGGMQMGGWADIVGEPFVPSGGMVMAGTSPVTFNAGIAPTGGMRMGGEAVMAFVLVSVYNLADDGVPLGGMFQSGEAIVADKITYVPTGGMVMGGEAPVLEAIPFTSSGGMLVGGSAPVSFVDVVLPTGGMTMSGTAPSSSAWAVTPEGGMKMSGAAVVSDYQAFFQPTGGMYMGGTAVAYMVASYLQVTPENPYADPFPGWAVNIENNAASRYMGLPANSIARFKGRSFVSNASGIHEVGGDTDAGQPIAASVEFLTTDFSTSFEKRMEKAYLGVRSNGKLRLKVKVKGKDPQYYVIEPSQRNDGAEAKGTRVPIGKGLVGRYWGMRLDNVDGADFELDDAEFNPARGTRRGA